MSEAPKRRRQRNSSRKPTIAWLEQPFRLLKSPIKPLDWLPEEKIEAIHNASMDILENVGMAFMDKQALDLWEQAGADVNHKTELVKIDRELLLELVAKTPSSFTWHARNPKYNLTIGDGHINFVPNSGMPFASDLDNGRRDATSKDYENFVKLAHTIPYFHFAGGLLVESQDIPVSLRHLHRTRSMVNLTDKAIKNVSHGYIIPEDVVKMLELVFGSPLPMAVTGGVVNVTSPLRLDDRMIGGMIAYARHNQATIVTPFIMAGATSPITMAAAIAQQNAEALGGIALCQLARAGSPAMYGGFAQNIDMRTGSPSFGAPEGAWGTLVAAQLARRYNVPFRASGSLTNSQVPDAQASLEANWSMWPCILAQTNIVYHAVGWLEGGLVASFEKFILDTETIGMMYHFLESFEIDTDSLAVQSIADVGIGGHHLDTKMTQDNYKSAFYDPVISSRQNFEQWEENGSKDALQRANSIYKAILEQYEQPHLDDSIKEALDDFVARRTEELKGVNLYS